MDEGIIYFRCVQQMWKQFSYVALLSCIALEGFGQDTAVSSVAKRYYMTRWVVQFKPLQAMFVEFPVSAEYTYDRHGFGVEIAYRPAWRKNLALIEYEYVERLWENYRALNYFNPLQNALTVGTFYKLYFESRRIIHLKMHWFYRRWWFTDKVTAYQDKVRSWEQGYQFSGIRSETQDIYGVKLTFGATFSIPTKGFLELVLEPYTGFGYRHRAFFYETKNGKLWDEPVELAEERGNENIFTLQFGLSIGFASPLKSFPIY